MSACAGMGGGVGPTVDLELWESGGGSALATLASGVTVSSETGQVLSVTWDAALLATADGSAVELRVVGHASTDFGDERAAEVGAVAWRSGYAVPGPELYFLRARYYDPSIGRFISRDIVETANRYAYGWANPVLYVDPNGEWGIPKISCDVCGRVAREAVDKVGDCAASSTCRTIVATGAVAVGTVAGGPVGVALVGVGTGALLATDARDCVGGSGVSCGSLAVGVASLGASQVVTKVPGLAFRVARVGRPHELMLQEASAWLATRAVTYLPSSRVTLAGGFFGISRGIYEFASRRVTGSTSTPSIGSPVLSAAE